MSFMKPKLNKPWLVAVWPGMGQVAIAAGYYLMAKLGMDQLVELPSRELFDVEQVEVKDGLIRNARLPRSRLFGWKDPRGRRDVVVFIGEAQPPQGKYDFCLRLIECARHLGVERIFTFAAMGTQMHPTGTSRVFGAAIDSESLADLGRLDLEIIREGQIGGLNGVLLGVAAEQGLRGSCLLGEMPHIFAHFPYPKASLAVLDAFTAMAGIEVDVAELAEQARHVEQQLGDLLSKVEEQLEIRLEDPNETTDIPVADPEPETPALSVAEQARIEGLFVEASRDRAKAYELKRLLDQLGQFKVYEDRFLDLFKHSATPPEPGQPPEPHPQV